MVIIPSHQLIIVPNSYWCWFTNISYMALYPFGSPQMFGDQLVIVGWDGMVIRRLKEIVFEVLFHQ